MKLSMIFVAIIALGSESLWAAEEQQDRFFPSEEEKNTPFFDRESWVSTTHIAYYGPEDKVDRNIQMTMLNVGAERYFWKNVGIVADASFVSTSGYIISDDSSTRLNSDSFGIGGSLGLKWHFLRGARWSAYVNGTVGLLFTDGDFPSGGTSWNGMERADLGITIRLQDQLHLIASGSLVHVSNGKGLNDENPAFNGEGGYIGLVYRFDTLGIFN